MLLPKILTPRTEYNLCSGLYVMHGGISVGKTLHGLAMAYHINAEYLYVNEPRANYKETYKSLFTEEFLMTRNLFCKYINSDSCTHDVIFVDSLNHIIREASEGPGMKGGLTPGQLKELLIIDRVALNCDKCVIALINSDIVPNPSVFEGQIEGAIEIVSSGIVSIRDRAQRTHKPYEIPLEHLKHSCSTLGYGEWQPSSKVKELKIGLKYRGV